MNALRKFLPVVAVAVMCVASSAYANTVTVTFTGVPAGDLTLTIKDPSWASSETGYIDPYNGTVNGQPVLLFCVDPLHDVSSGDTWTAYVGNPTNPSTLSDSYQVIDYNKLSTTAADTLYEEMAALAAKLEGTPASATNTRLELQAAIWELADQNSKSTPSSFDTNLIVTAPSGDPNFATNVSNDIQWAIANPLTSGFEVLSDTNNQIQEYIVLTPEPASLLLLGLGLCAVVVWKRRERVALVS